jgi:hypothetical protein
MISCSSYKYHKLVSFICVTKDEPLVLSAVISILSAGLNLEDYEILVRDASTVSNPILEGTLELSGCQYSYKRSNDLGPYDAMNSAIKSAWGKYCIILNSDDTLIADSARLIIQRLKYNHPDIVYADALIQVSNGSAYSYNSRLLPRLSRFVHPLISMPVPHSGFICKTTILREFPFNLLCGLEADYCQMLDILSSNLLCICDMTAVPIIRFSTSGLSSRREFFSLNNPHINEIRMITLSLLPDYLKFVAVVFRVVKVILLFPFKLISAFCNWITACHPNPAQ